MGVVFSGMFGLGIVLYTKVETDVHLDHILFGDMLGVAWPDVLQSGIIAAIVLIAIGLKWRDLLLHAFDPQQARAVGLPVRVLHYGLLCILSLTIVGALKATGIILTISLLIAPGAIAFLLTNRFGPMLIASVLIAGIRIFPWCVSQLLLDSAPAPTLVLLMTMALVAAFLLSPKAESVGLERTHGRPAK
jgi:manganese/iron transport system permease protein